MTSPTPQEKLKAQIMPLIQHCKGRRTLNQSLNVGIGLAGILLGLGATVAGTLSDNNARIAAIFGASSATTQAILFAYPVGKRERIHRKAIADLENLLSDLEIRSDIDQNTLERLLERFKEIRLNALLEDEGKSDVENSRPQTIVSGFSNSEQNS
jgi:hypothetical protein